MQVTHVQDHVTHAVIGGGEAMSFGMSDSAEFFNILSNTLYSDKPLAVVREVLCNAWDAHIQSGRTHLPVIVTLTPERLTIRDFGTGIAKEDMHQVYCVYGNSTKKHDGKQTGGFGLGCKAPFAYTDHFEVISFSKGIKTIYRISKSSGEVGGKPGLTPIMSVPTDEHGLLVSIDLIHPQDATKFNTLIKRIASVGEMNVKLNDVLIEPIPFSKSSDGFLITDKSISDAYSQRLFVRYGNVAYPIPSHDAYSKQYKKAVDLLTSLNGRGYSAEWKLLLQAEPNTISVTPSRESLSMTDFTIKTLDSLLEKFNSLRDQQLKIESMRQAEESVERAVSKMKPAALLNSEHKIPFTDRHQTNDYLTDFRSVARTWLVNHYPTTYRFRERDVKTRLRALIQSGFGNRGLIQTYLKAFLKESRHRHIDTNWFHRRLVTPLVLDLKTEPLLTPSRLLVIGRDETSGRNRRLEWGSSEFTEAQKFHKRELESYLPFLRNFVILAYNRTDVDERAPIFPAMQHWFGPVQDSLVYMVQRSEPRAEAARAFFKARGFYVLDLTRRAKWEPEPVVEEVEKREYKPRKKGIPRLDTVFPDGAARIHTDLFKVDEAERIEEPEFVVKIANRNDQGFFADFDNQTSEDIVRLFGSKGGIVVNDSQHTKYVAAGAKNIDDWLFEKIQAEYKSNVRIQQSLTVDLSKYTSTNKNSIGLDTENILRIALEDQYIRAYFNVSHSLTDADKRYIRLWRVLANRLRWSPTREVRAFEAYLAGIKTSQEFLKLIQDAQKSNLKGMLDWSKIERALKPTRNPDGETLQQQAKARDLLIWAIKG